jgi:hypothetical protein
VNIRTQGAIALPRRDALDWGQAAGRVVIAFLLLVAVALAVGVSERIRRPLAPVATRPDNKCWNYKPTEKGFAQKINAARVAAGQGKLSIDPELSRVAREQTKTMVNKNLLHHTPESALRRRVLNWSSLGENVGVGATVDSLHQAFMDSPAHRANILHSPFRHSGIGVTVAGGRMWVTVLFEATNDPHTSLGMPSC